MLKPGNLRPEAVDRKHQCARTGEVVVAATHRGEGCSTIAAQLARYAASTGVRTVLVDADLRNRGLTKALGVEPSTS